LKFLKIVTVKKNPFFSVVKKNPFLKKNLVVNSKILKIRRSKKNPKKTDFGFRWRVLFTTVEIECSLIAKQKRCSCFFAPDVSNTRGPRNKISAAFLFGKSLQISTWFKRRP